MKAVTRRVDKLPGTDADRVNLQNLITFYNEAPQDELSLDEFELFALDRLQLLRGIEACHVRKLDSAEVGKKMKELENKYMPLRSNQSATCSGGLSTDQRKDVASHFILRLAYCRNEDLRRWFVNQEQALFRYRFEMLSAFERKQFMDKNGFGYDQVREDEKLRLRGELQSVLFDERKFGENQYYKVPFAEALSLVADRSVYLERGFAYVPLSDLLQVIILQVREMSQFFVLYLLWCEPLVSVALIKVAC
jgi:DNA primase large subunit